MSALFNTLQRLVNANRPDMAEKINNLYAFGQLTEEQYQTLMQQLQPDQERMGNR